MRSIVFDSADDPGSVLQLRDVPQPQPSSKNVVIEVRARPIQPADLAFVQGRYRIRPQFPQIAGLEGAGVVAAAPPGSEFTPGSRVAFRWPGAWADFVAVPPSRLVRVPADMSDDDACQISLNPLTAFALLHEARIPANAGLIVTAATSTVSNIVAAIARVRGIRTVGVVRGDAASARARCSTDRVVSADDPNVADSIVDALGGSQAAGLLDSVGGSLIERIFPALATGSRIIAYGVQSAEPAAVTNAMLIYSNLTWAGFGIDRWIESMPAPALEQAYAELWNAIRNGSIQLPVSSTYPLGSFERAITANAERGRRGKVLLVS